jgi:hypothetical protein
MNSPFDTGQNILIANMLIYTSRNGGNYFYLGIENDKVYFSIPNRQQPERPFQKGITNTQFTKLLQTLVNNGAVVTKDFPFRDCRIAAFYGIVNTLNPNTINKTHDRISLLNFQL